MFSYLPITVSIEDVNDNIPEFVNAPYGPIVIDELAPPGTEELFYFLTNYIHPLRSLYHGEQIYNYLRYNENIFCLHIFYNY